MNTVRLKYEIMKANNLQIVKGIFTQMIEKWIIYYQYAINMYVINVTNMTVFHEYYPSGTSTEICLTFIIAQQHIFPITDPILRQHVIKCKQIDLMLINKKLFIVIIVFII